MLFGVLRRVKAYFDAKGVSPVPTFVEADVSVFFIFPILMKIKFGLLLASLILLFDILII